jgi:hypothetical protein
MEAGREPLPADAFFDEDLVTVERVIASKEEEAPEGGVGNTGPRRRMYLVKWRGLSYNEATWEWAADIKDVRWGGGADRIYRGS